MCTNESSTSPTEFTTDPEPQDNANVDENLILFDDNDLDILESTGQNDDLPELTEPILKYEMYETEEMIPEIDEIEYDPDESDLIEVDTPDLEEQQQQQQNKPSISDEYQILHVKPIRTNKTSARRKPPESDTNGPPKTMKVCVLCGNEYKYQHALDSHMRRHRNQKPFECE